MPLVNIRLTRRDEPTTRAQKDALIAGVTKLMQEVLAKRPESVVVIIDEVDPDNWGEGGESVRVLRERRKALQQKQPAGPALRRIQERIGYRGKAASAADMRQAIADEAARRGKG